MIISLKFLEELINAKKIKIIKVPDGHYIYEYATQHFDNTTVFGIIELENTIVDDITNKVIGHFGMDLEHNIFVYYLKG